MAKSKLLHPQFFHTLVPGFQTHLMIPLDFFSNYIEGRSVDNAAQLKSDSSDITWQVKMTGRILGEGWREFAVGQSLQVGHVILVRYEGDMVFHVSSDRCEIPRNNNDDDKHKHSRPRTDFDDLPDKKRAKTNSNDTEANSSSSLDNSCFVATVTAFNLLIDTLYLPQHFASSNGFTREPHKIVLIDGEGKSWTLDLSFNESSDTFYMSHGWRSFCEENGQEAGGFFKFKLVANGETPVLSLCPTESINSNRQTHSSEEEEEEDETLMETEEKKCNPKRRAVTYSSYSPYHKRFLTFTLPPDYFRIERLSLPKQFLTENGITKPGEICLLGKDGVKWPTRLLRDNKGTMSLGKGWRDFVKANGLEKGFTLKLIWQEDTTPAFSLCCADSTSDREQEEYFKYIKKQSRFIDSSNRDSSSKDDNNKEENMSCERGSTFVTLTITPSSVSRCRLGLLKSFTRENDINKPGMITLLGKDGIKHPTRLLFDKTKRIFYLGAGWIGFAEANGLKIGDSFTLKFIQEDETPMLSLYSEKGCSIDRETGGESSEETSKEESNIQGTCREERSHLRCVDSSNRMRLPKQFVMENNMNKAGMIYLLGKDDKKWMAKLVKERDGRMKIGTGWTVFAEANGFKPGESVTLESSIWEDGAPMIRFLRTVESNSSKANKKDSVSTEVTESRTRDSSSESQDRFVTLTLIPEDVKACMLILPSQFLKANGINRYGKITILGENEMEFSGYLLSRGGTVALEDGWDKFCEANGVKLGESFTLEFVKKPDKRTHVFKFCSREIKK